MNQREGNMTTTLFVVCFCYFLFVGPMILLEQVATIFHNFSNQTVYLCIFCLYWFQYSFNFIIYVIRGEQYRKAYIFFLSQVSFINVAIKWKNYRTRSITRRVFYFPLRHFRGSNNQIFRGGSFIREGLVFCWDIFGVPFQ